MLLSANWTRERQRFLFDSPPIASPLRPVGSRAVSGLRVTRDRLCPLPQFQVASIRPCLSQERIRMGALGPPTASPWQNHPCTKRSDDREARATLLGR